MVYCAALAYLASMLNCCVSPLHVKGSCANVFHPSQSWTFWLEMYTLVFKQTCESWWVSFLLFAESKWAMPDVLWSRENLLGPGFWIWDVLVYLTRLEGFGWFCDVVIVESPYKSTLPPPPKKVTFQQLQNVFLPVSRDSWLYPWSTCKLKEMSCQKRFPECCLAFSVLLGLRLSLVKRNFRVVSLF